MADSDQTQKLLKEIADSLQAAGSSASNTLNKFSNSIDTNTRRFAGAMNAGVVPITQTITNIGKLGAAVPILGNVFESLTNTGANVVQYFEDSISTYQTLSKVGAGLSGNLNQLRATVTDSRLGLQGFTEFVSKNSQDLIRFGGSVDQGAMMLGKIGNSLRDTGMDVRFEQLGFTTEELTEFTTKYLAQNQRSARMEGKSMEEQITRAARYAKQLTTMSRLTGESIQSMQDDINNRKKAGATQAALQLAEIQGGKGAVKAYEESQGALRQAAPVVRNLLDDLIQTGAPMSDATRNFAALNSETYGLLQEAAAATKRGDIETAKKLSEKAAAEAAAFAQSEEGLRIAALAQVSDVAQTQADAFEEIGPIIDRVKGGVENLGEIAGDSGKFLDAWNKQVEASRQEIQNVYDSLSEGGNIRRTIQAGQRATTDAGVEAQRRVNEMAYGADIDYEEQMKEFQLNVSQGIATDFSKQAMASIDTLTSDILGLQSDDKVLEYLQNMSNEDKARSGIDDETISKFKEYLDKPVGEEKTALRKELGPEFFDKQTGILESVRNTLINQKQEEIDAVKMQEDANALKNYDTMSEEDKKAMDYGVQSMTEEGWEKLKSLLDNDDIEKFEEVRQKPIQPQVEQTEVPVSAADVSLDGKLQVTLTPNDFNVTLDEAIPVVSTATERSAKSSDSTSADAAKEEMVAVGKVVRDSAKQAMFSQTQSVDSTLQTLAESRQSEAESKLPETSVATSEKTLVDNIVKNVEEATKGGDSIATSEKTLIDNIVNTVEEATKGKVVTASQTASTNKNDVTPLAVSINDLINYLRERDNAAKAQTANLDPKLFQPLIDKLDSLYSINTSVNSNLVKIANAMKNEAKYV